MSRSIKSANKSLIEKGHIGQKNEETVTPVLDMPSHKSHLAVSRCPTVANTPAQRRGYNPERS